MQTVGQEFYTFACETFLCADVWPVPATQVAYIIVVGRNAGGNTLKPSSVDKVSSALFSDSPFLAVSVMFVLEQLSALDAEFDKAKRPDAPVADSIADRATRERATRGDLDECLRRRYVRKREYPKDAQGRKEVV